MSPSIGDACIDGYKQASSWLDNGIEWLADVIDFYRERAAIEREASAKLASLASKHFSKKASITAAVSVGDHPVTTPGSLENMTMQSWMETLNQTEKMSVERKKLADEFVRQICDELTFSKTRFEEISRAFKKLNDSITEHRDETIKQVKKSKQHYDSCCESMESARAKSKKSLESKENEMYKAKNSYLVQINVANRMKDKYHHDDMPEMLDAMQVTNEARVAQTNRHIILAGNLEKRRLKNISQCIGESVASLEKNEPFEDTHMFVEHNANAFQWTDPADFFFEPSPIWHDNDQMYCKSEDSLKHLSALLGDANTKSVTSSAESEKAMAVYEQAKGAVAAANFKELVPQQATPLLRAKVSSLQKLVECENKRLGIEVEIEAIEAATASVDMSHVPQTRMKKHRNLFGRKKEVIEVVQKDSAGAGHSSRSLGMSSLLARTNLSKLTGKSFNDATQASVLYDFEAGGPGEMSVSAGRNYELLLGDDGSGWVKLKDGPDSGLVPATYVEIIFGGRETPNEAAPPPPPPARGSQDQKVMALYDYEAKDDFQLTIRANDFITILKADDGSGWSHGSIGDRQGIFPTAYARHV